MNDSTLWQLQLPVSVTGAAALMQAPSLTRALRALNRDFSVRLLYLGHSDAEPLLHGGVLDNMPASGRFSRDVLLCLDGEPVVWARSQCHESAEAWRELLDCGTRPLGERLFDGSLPLLRSPFEYAVPESDTRLAGFSGRAVAARRSFFTLHGETLGLVECFLPSLTDYFRCEKELNCI